MSFMTKNRWFDGSYSEVFKTVRNAKLLRFIKMFLYNNNICLNVFVKLEEVKAYPTRPKICFYLNVILQFNYVSNQKTLYRLSFHYFIFNFVTIISSSFKTKEQNCYYFKSALFEASLIF